MTTINVTALKIKELNAASAILGLENGRISKTVFVNGVEYVTTGSVGDGKGVGVVSVDGYTIDDVHTWAIARHFEKRADDIEPMAYRNHWAAVNAGLRERSYRGMSVYFHNRHIVLLEKVLFTSSAEAIEAEQLTMF
jgi:hypothetical protein